MPVRIYDIAKKLGIESKEVLAKAKELGIAGAKVPSSSIDKITAEYLEEQLGGGNSVAVAEAPRAHEPVVIVSAPPEPPPAPVDLAPPATPLTLESGVKPEDATDLVEARAPAPPPPVAPLEPPSPPKPAIGEKVGFIQLPQKPAPKIGPKVGPIKLPPKPPAPMAKPARPADRAAAFPASQKPAARVPAQPAAPTPPQFVPPATGELITLKPPIVVRELAEQLKRKPFQLIADLMELGVFANLNQSIDETTAQKLCAKYGFRFEVEKRERGAGIVHAPPKPVEKDVEDKPEDLKLRAPVVTIMGHVDHGKTTLLDVIRKSNVAANDGVMPQTLEALSHAQAAKVQIIVAVNKCDHPNANPMKVRQQLQDKGLVCEEWGGNTIFVDVSALTKQGIDKLLEMIVLQAEILELKANPNRPAKGNVIESGLEPGGPTATVLVRKGTMRVGDMVICGQFWGKVRALINEEGKRLKDAGPSVAVKVLGLNGVPEAGLEFSVVENEKDARALAEDRIEKIRSEEKERRPKVTLENLFETLASETSKILKIVVKADTQGSVEAIVEALKKIETDKVFLEIIHSAVGTITESDVILASASQAIVLGFHTRVDNGVSEVAKREGVQIKLYAIIYELIDEVKEAMAGLLDPLIKEVVVGSAEVRKVFTLSKGGNVAGCVVTNGRIVKGKMRVQRRKGLIYEGVSLSLRRFQDEVNEVRAGMECGIRLDGFNDFQVGDLIECYTLEKVQQKL